MKNIFFGFLLLGGVLASACVTPTQIEVVQKEQTRLKSETSAVRTEADKVQSSLAGTRADLADARVYLADTRANIDKLQRDLNALKEKVEEVHYQLDRQIGRSASEGDQRIKQLEARLGRLDDELKMQSALLKAREDELRALRQFLVAKATEREAPPPAPVTSAEPAREVVASIDSEAVKRDYEEAWRLMERKDYRSAIARFKDFLRKYSSSEFGDNAQYWVGECYYALREFDQAILEFDAVRRKYPKGEKVPAALLKQGFAFAELGDKVDARLILQELVDRYPQSQEAAKAKQKLKAMES